MTAGGNFPVGYSLVQDENHRFRCLRNQQGRKTGYCLGEPILVVRREKKDHWTNKPQEEEETLTGQVVT